MPTCPECWKEAERRASSRGTEATELYQEVVYESIRVHSETGRWPNWHAEEQCGKEE